MIFLGIFSLQIRKKTKHLPLQMSPKISTKISMHSFFKKTSKTPKRHSDNFEDPFPGATIPPWEAPHPYGARNLLWAPWWLSILFQEGFWNGEGPIFVASFDGRVDKKKSLSEALANVLAF